MRGERGDAMRIWCSLAVILACVMSGMLLTWASASAAGACPNEQLRAEDHSTYLPDCRAYELVTPAYKEGALVLLSEPGEISADGSRVIVRSLGAFAATEDVPLGEVASGASYEPSRTSVGWVTVPLVPPATRFPIDFGGSARQLVSADLGTTSWLLNASSPGPAEPPGFQQNPGEDLYLRRPDGSFLRVGPTTLASLEQTIAYPQRGSSDLSHIFFVLEQGFLWPGDATARGPQVGLAPQPDPSLYESNLGAVGAEPKLVGVRNNGPLHGSPHINEGAELISQCGTELAYTAPGSGSPGAAYPWVPAGGRTVFFRALDGNVGVCGNEKGLQKECEEEGKSAAECEAQLAAKHGPRPHAPQVSELYARLDGSKTVAISEPSPPLCSSPQCLNAEKSERQPAFFQGASEDGKRVFFTTTQPLVNEDTDSTNDVYEAEIEGEGEGAKVGRLIQVSRGDSSDPTPGSGAKVLGVSAIANDGSRVYFVAEGVLTSAANGDGQTAVAGVPNLYVAEPASGRTTFIAPLLSSDEEHDWAREASAVRLTPDGRFLVFASGQQIFEYDAQTGRLATIATEGAEVRVSNDGSYVFFMSSAALTPRALNDPRHVIQNIYEYHSGHVSLISDGQDVNGVGASLLGIDASGENVFFTTVDPLVSQDTDTQSDVYDARVNGGFPAAASPAGCSGDGCQGPSSMPPSAPVPGSLTQIGGGNLTPPSPLAKPKPRSLSRAQKLAKALKACHTKHNRQRRKACERQARKRYGPTKAKKASHTTTTRKGGK